MKNKIPTGKYILIEPLLYGEYHIAIYNNFDFLLDKKYYVSGIKSAIMCATDLKDKDEYKNLSIFIVTPMSFYKDKKWQQEDFYQELDIT